MPKVPYTHTAPDHEKDGMMEVNVHGLQGALASLQNPKVHDHLSSVYGHGGLLDLTQYLKLDCSNDPMLGELDMGGFKIVGLLDPDDDQDAVTLSYFEANCGGGGITNIDGGDADDTYGAVGMSPIDGGGA